MSLKACGQVEQDHTNVHDIYIYIYMHICFQKNVYIYETYINYIYIYILQVHKKMDQANPLKVYLLGSKSTLASLA